jgi:hypothetical protein
MERIYRNRLLSPEEVARDKAVRDKIREEFPPAHLPNKGHQDSPGEIPISPTTPSADRLLELAQSLAEEWAEFFQKKGPGAGDLDTNAFMMELRTRAHRHFGQDFSERRICGDNKLTPDFYFPNEETIVEVAMGLRNPLSEFERDILKAIIAQDAKHPVRRLVFLSKPGAKARISQPGLHAFVEWVLKSHGIQVEVCEFTPVAEAVLDAVDEEANR